MKEQRTSASISSRAGRFFFFLDAFDGLCSFENLSVKFVTAGSKLGTYDLFFRYFQ